MGAVCDSWINMSHVELDLVCQKLNFDRAYSFWTATIPKAMYANIQTITVSDSLSTHNSKSITRQPDHR